MAHCPGCDTDFEADELTRHEIDGMVHVHCPDCGRKLGDWNAHAGHGTPDQ
jgi:Zn ribbon nucleic-acid-binding protein